MELAHQLVDAILDKKGSNIMLLDIRDQAVFTDYFILCNGENRQQVRALTEGIAESAIRKGQRRPNGIEGDPDSGWTLVDFGELIIHIFSPEQRNYYNLEELWRKAHVVLRVQ